MGFHRSGVAVSLLSFLIATAADDPGRAEKASPHDDKPGRSEKELPAPALFGRVSPSIVVIVASGKQGVQGSGVVIGPGQVVTNHHVVSGAARIEVRQGETHWPATAEAVDPKHDLAILAVDGLDRPRVSLRASTALSVGERVYAIGAPRGLELTLSDGLVSALRREKPEKTSAGDVGPAVIQTTVPISPGSSGGGLFDAQGRLIGITTFSATASQNLNFAHPTEWIEALRAPKLGGSGAPAASARPLPSFTLSNRPKVLRCRIDTRAIWGLFSGGAEMLESKPTTLDMEVTRFNSQTPAFSGAPAGEPAFGELVLADMNRDAGFVVFTGTESSRNVPEYFFAMDDDGRFRLTLLRGFDFHGQLRVRASSGACDPVDAPKPKPLVADEHSRERCEAGDVDACVAAGAAVEGENRMTALSLFLKGCDQARPGDRVAHAASVAHSCREAARVCDRLGYRARAAELRERQARLQRASGEQ